MSQALLGSVNIHVIDFDVQINEATISEVGVVADPTTPNANNTVLSGTGFKRNAYTLQLRCSAAELISLKAYHVAKSSNLLKIYLKEVLLISENCIITQFSYRVSKEDSLIVASMKLVGG